jgi:hypothetical protein
MKPDIDIGNMVRHHKQNGPRTPAQIFASRNARPSQKKKHRRARKQNSAQADAAR